MHALPLKLWPQIKSSQVAANRMSELDAQLSLKDQVMIFFFVWEYENCTGSHIFANDFMI